MPPHGADCKQPIGWLNIPYILMPYNFASWQLGVFTCAKHTRLLNYFMSSTFYM